MLNKQESPNDKLTRLGNELRELWAEEYRRFHLKHGQDRIFIKDITADGGRDSSGRVHTYKWTEYARILLSNNVDLSMAVRTTFERAGARPPLPNMLISKANIEKCQEKIATQPEDLKMALKIQSEQFRSKVFVRLDLYDNDRTKTTSSVLCDPAIDLSPLFRYALCRLFNLLEIAEIWQQLAAEQYLQMPDAYDKNWSIIPDDFKAWARTEHSKVISA